MGMKGMRVNRPDDGTLQIRESRIAAAIASAILGTVVLVVGGVMLVKAANVYGWQLPTVCLLLAVGGSVIAAGAMFASELLGRRVDIASKQHSIVVRNGLWRAVALSWADIHKIEVRRGVIGPFQAAWVQLVVRDRNKPVVLAVNAKFRSTQKTLVTEVRALASEISEVLGKPLEFIEPASTWIP